MTGHRTHTEDGLIRTIRRAVRSRGRVRLGIGDDAAVLSDGTVLTTDAYAEGVHFDLSYMSFRQVGARCACGAVSDVIAMAAEPEAVFVSLALPRNALCLTPDAGRPTAAGVKRRSSSIEQQVRQLYSGIESVCAETGCEVAGGDIIVADRLLLALTVTGRTRRPRLRSGARPGDRLYVTGQLGSAEAGRMLLQDEDRSQKSEIRSQNRRGGQPESQSGGRIGRGDWRLPLVRRHLRPVPRLAAMKVLRRHIHGLIDTSDGLATDARHISEMSGVRIVLEAGAIPIDPATRRFCAYRGKDPVDFVLAAGEDYELLCTSRNRLPSSVKGVKVTVIGRVEKGRGLWIERAGRILPAKVAGYDHLMPPGLGKTCY
ncbi:thiamine-monophosphate kinase [candidate division WOR-3 bacterium]|nr:thiamine-monophosphate kinase [candidate division WOR-3 bacterium]